MSWRSPGAARSWISRSSWSGSPWPTTTSSNTGCIPTSISTPASSITPLGFRSRCFQSCSPSVERQAGWHSGKRVCSIRSRRSPGPDRSTSDPPNATCPEWLRQQPEPAEAEQAADDEDDRAERQQRDREVQLGRHPADPRAQLTVDLVQLTLVGREVVMAGRGAGNRLQGLLIDAVDDAAAKQGRLVSLPDADCLHRDVILFCVPRGRDRVDAGIG